MAKCLLRVRQLIHVIVLVVLLAQNGRATTWTREVYIWQRQQIPGVMAAYQALAPLLDGACVLAAEVSCDGGHVRIIRPSLDYERLAAAGKPIGLALRIGAYGGPFLQDDETARKLSALASDLLAQAASASLRVSELQIDFDCAESNLAGYRQWLLVLRKAALSTPLVFTALPSWLKSPAMRDLAGSADGFVLQVHSLEKPAGPDAPYSLCNPIRALAWVTAASRLGVPFRVALPTYGYRLAFDAGGKFFALSAEGPRPAWPADTQIRLVRADAVAMARLEQTLAKEKPAGCTGVIWFRLPVAGDELNWGAVTFAAILRGETPVSRLDITTTWSAAGLAEIRLVNRGQLSEPLPDVVRVDFAADSAPLALDGLGGYAPQTPRPIHGELFFKAAPATTARVLAPDRSYAIGWLRFSHETVLSLQISPAR